MKTSEKGIRVRASLFTLTVDIEGVIGVAEKRQFESEDERVATYEKFRRTLQRIEQSKARRIVVNIRSLGGDVGDALLIYEALRASGREVITRCYGYVASAATIIAQAADKGRREVAASSLYLIHRCHGSYEGNVEELEEARNMLSQSDRRLAEIYAERAGRGVDEILELMGANSGRGRWLSPSEAVALGLADKVIEREKKGPAAELNFASGDLPPLPEAIENMKLNPDKKAKSGAAQDGAPAAGSGRKSVDDSNAKSVAGHTKTAAGQNTQIADTEEYDRPTSQVQVGLSARVMKLYEAKSPFEQARPTTVETTEDPSLKNKSLSANQLAYMNDARAISDR